MDQKIVFGMGAVVLAAAVIISELIAQGTFRKAPVASVPAEAESPAIAEASLQEYVPDFDGYLVPDAEYYEGETKPLTPTGMLTGFSGAIASATPPLANFAGQYAVSEWQTAPDRIAGVVFNAQTAEPIAVMEGIALQYHFDSRLLVVHTPTEDLFFILDAGLNYLGSEPLSGEYAAITPCSTQEKMVTTGSFGILSYPSYCPNTPSQPLNPQADVAS